MERKNGVATVEVVEAAEVRSALPKTTTLTSEEEKILRMRYAGVKELYEPVALTALAQGDLPDELLLLEMELLRGWRAHLASKAAKTARATWSGAPAVTSRTRDKILRALRKKR